MIGSVVLAGLALCQGSPAREARADRVLPIELAGAEASSATYAVKFDGSLHAWTEPTDSDLALGVLDTEGRELARAPGGPGGSAPYVALDVRAGQGLVFEVSPRGSPRGAAAVELHLRASPESEATRAAAAAAHERLGESSGATRLATLLAELDAVPGGEASELVADAVRRVGDAAADLGDLETWRAARERLVAAWSRTRPSDHDELLHARLDLAVVRSMQGELAAARAVQEAVLERVEHARDEHDGLVQRAREGLAIVLRSQGELARAVELQERVLAAYEESGAGDEAALLGARENLGTSLREAGDLAGALELLEAVAEGRERLHGPGDRRTTLARLNLAAALYQRGELAAARVLQEEGVARLEEELPEEHPDLLGAQTSLAVTLEGMEDPARARELLEHVLAVRRRSLGEGHPELCVLLLNLAALHKVQGDYPGARVLEEQAVAGLEASRPPEHPELLAALENLAITLEALGDVPRSLELEERVLAAREAALPDDDLALNRTRLNLGGTYYVMGELERSREMFELAVEALEGVVPEENPELLGARTNLALVAKLNGDLVRAAELEEDVLAVRRRTLSEDHPDVLRLRHNLAITLMWDGERRAARAQGLALAEGLVRRTLGALALAPREVGELLARDGRKLGQVLALAEGADGPLRELAFELVEARRVASCEGVRSAFVDASDPELARLVSEVLRARAELGELAGARRAVGERETRLERLSLERDEAERRVRARLARGGVRAERVRSSEVAAHLDARAAAVGFLRYERWAPEEGTGRAVPSSEHLLAHVVRPDGSLARVELGPADELERALAAWRAALGRALGRGVGVELAGDERGELEHGTRLRELLLDPVLEASGPDVETLHVCAADLVHLVPLDALPRGDGRVGDRVRTVLWPSLARLIGAPPGPLGSPSLLALGDVDYGSGAEFPALPGTGPEVRDLAARFAESFEGVAVVLEGGGATRAALLERAPGSRFLHLATHGWFAGRFGAGPGARSAAPAAPAAGEFAPMLLCGLALAGANDPWDPAGAITAEELAGFDLSGCELAVLSACETNVGLARAGLGIQSLQAALQTAGARTAITSLWRVDDEATRALFEEFYARIWGAGETKAEALWNAKSALRARGRPARDWAGWVLSGDPR